MSYCHIVIVFKALEHDTFFGACPVVTMMDFGKIGEKFSAVLEVSAFVGILEGAFLGNREIDGKSRAKSQYPA